MNDLFGEPDDAIPLTPDERQGLIPSVLGDGWRWAGDFRTKERKLGIPHHEVPIAMRELLDDVKA